MSKRTKRAKRKLTKKRIYGKKKCTRRRNSMRKYTRKIKYVGGKPGYAGVRMSSRDPRETQKRQEEEERIEAERIEAERIEAERRMQIDTRINEGLDIGILKHDATMRRSASAIEQFSSPEFQALSAEEQLKLLPPVRKAQYDQLRITLGFNLLMHIELSRAGTTYNNYDLDYRLASIRKPYSICLSLITNMVEGELRLDYIKPAGYETSGHRHKYFSFEIFGQKVLYIIFNSGRPFTTDLFEMTWVDLYKQLEQLIKDHDTIVICGHSMGAGLSFYTLIKLFDNTDIDFTNKSISIVMTGLGRVPTRLAIRFQELQEENGFDVLDIMCARKLRSNGQDIEVKDSDWASMRPTSFTRASHDQQVKLLPVIKKVFKGELEDDGIDKLWIDRCMDKTTINDSECHGYKCNNKFNEYVNEYGDCRNIYDICEWNLKTKENVTESSDEGICSSGNWGEMYGDKWNTCQDLLDEFHSHNRVNTYILFNDGSYELVYKNSILKEYKIKHFEPSFHFDFTQHDLTYIKTDHVDNISKFNFR